MVTVYVVLMAFVVQPKQIQNRFHAFGQRVSSMLFDVSVLVVKQMRNRSIDRIAFNERDFCFGQDPLDTIDNVENVISWAGFPGYDRRRLGHHPGKLGVVEFVGPVSIGEKVQFFVKWRHELGMRKQLSEKRSRT